MWHGKVNLITSGKKYVNLLTVKIVSKCCGTDGYIMLFNKKEFHIIMPFLPSEVPWCCVFVSLFRELKSSWFSV